MEKHTEGKICWKQFGTGYGLYTETGGSRVVLIGKNMLMQGGKGQSMILASPDHPDAQRLAACWNATLGIATEDLEAGAIGRLVEAAQANQVMLRRLSEYLWQNCEGKYVYDIDQILDKSRKALSAFEKASASPSQPRRDEEGQSHNE